MATPWHTVTAAHKQKSLNNPWQNLDLNTASHLCDITLEGFDQIPPRDNYFTGERPEEVRCPDLVHIHQPIIHERLIDILGGSIVWG